MNVYMYQFLDFSELISLKTVFPSIASCDLSNWYTIRKTIASIDSSVLCIWVFIWIKSNHWCWSVFCDKLQCNKVVVYVNISLWFFLLEFFTRTKFFCPVHSANKQQAKRNFEKVPRLKTRYKTEIPVWFSALMNRVCVDCKSNVIVRTMDWRCYDTVIDLSTGRAVKPHTHTVYSCRANVVAYSCRASSERQTWS